MAFHKQEILQEDQEASCFESLSQIPLLYTQIQQLNTFSESRVSRQRQRA